VPNRILIVDNNAFYRQVLGDFFIGEGYEVSVAADGVQALELLETDKIDLVLLDLIMPRIDGARLCRFLKSDPLYKSIPVVILSGILVDEIEGIETIKADAYVAKMPMEKLQQTLREVIDSIWRTGAPPPMSGFEGMNRREVVVEFLEERRVRETILNALAEGIVELTQDQRILRSNRTFEELVGRKPEELLSRPLVESLPESADALGVLFRDASKQGAGAASVFVTRGDRTLRLRLQSLGAERSSASEIDRVFARAAAENPKVRLATGERFPGYVLLVQDVTEEANAQAERDRFRGRTALASRMSALGMFVAGAAHELNNPLTGVLGYAQMLAERDLPADVMGSLGKIEAGASRCKAIVENLLVFSRKSQSERRSQPLNAIIDSALEEHAARFEGAGVGIRKELASDLPPVTVNEAEILQALSAILENACLAAMEGPPPRVVTVRSSLAGGDLLVEIADGGPGIPEHLLEKIFDPFFTTREVGQGRGLGLSVAYGIARAHEGKVTAANAEDGGARVTFRIPAGTDLRSEETDLRSAREDAQGRPRASRQRGRILVVDDEPVVVELLSDILGEEHDVDTATNGRDGLSKAVEAQYDLIFLDIRMPDMSGRQVYEALLATRPALADRVVFTTGDMLQEDTRAFLDQIGQPCLPKPFSLEAVTEVAGRILSASGTE